MAEVKIYTTSVCPFCIAVKSLLNTLDVTFSEIRLDRDPALRLRLAEENNGWRTVPMVFVGDQMIGGFSEVKALHKDGRLLPLLGVLLVILNLLLQFYPGPGSGWFVDSNVLLHIGVITSIIGLLLVRALT